MKRLVWLTDIHLNLVDPDIVEHFLRELGRLRPSGLVITGDIGESSDVTDYLVKIRQRVDCPVFFVLGNHDYYFDSIGNVRARIAALCQEESRLIYMSDSQPVELVAGIGLIGHDGWADGRYGDYERSMVTMLDFKLIQDLAGLNKLDRWRMLKSLADQAATHIQVVLPHALEQFEYVYLITHVPPLREACWYEGSISDDEWAPHFTCKAMGQVILRLMRARPDRHLTVLCGHTHGSGQIRPLPNLRILTGGALYGYPSFAGVFALCQEPSHWR